MTKAELTAAVEAAKNETRIALQLVYDTLNQGQRKKLVANVYIKALFDRYDVAYES